MKKHQVQEKAHVIKHSRLCAYCGELREMDKRAKYCSLACKQAAYRARKTTPMERAIAKTSRYARMVETKAARRITIYCPVCREYKLVTGLQGRATRYCSRRCKDKAARARKAAKRALFSDHA